MKPETHNLNMEVGERLRGLRENKRLSQTNFIKEMEFRGLEISKSTYSRYECGDIAIPLPCAKEFCDYFGVETDYLINGIEISPDKQMAKIINLYTPEEIKTIYRFLTDIAKCMEEKQ